MTDFATDYRKTVSAPKKSVNILQIILSTLPTELQTEPLAYSMHRWKLPKQNEKKEAILHEQRPSTVSVANIMPQTYSVKKPPTNTYLEMRDNPEDQFKCVDGRSKQGVGKHIFFRPRKGVHGSAPTNS